MAILTVLILVVTVGLPLLLIASACLAAARADRRELVTYHNARIYRTPRELANLRLINRMPSR